MATCLLVTIFSAAICVQLSLAHYHGCAIVKCRANYECKQSKCIPIIKEGNCPPISYIHEIFRAMCPPNCKSDADCPGVQKCCPTPGCRFNCQNPGVSSCEGKKCPRGEKCILKVVWCLREPCYPVPQCVPSD